MKIPKTYNIGILQAKAFRILKKQTLLSLKEYGINSTDWAILGMINDSPEGVTNNYLAKNLGVSKPFITKTCRRLAEAGFLDTVAIESDKRSKKIILSSKGLKRVKNIEKRLRGELRYLVSRVSPGSLMGYKKTLEAINKNGAKLLEKEDLTKPDPLSIKSD